MTKPLENTYKRKAIAILKRPTKAKREALEKVGWKHRKMPMQSTLIRMIGEWARKEKAKLFA